MQPGRGGLKNETSFLKVLWVGSLPELVCGKAITVSWERLDNMLKGVRSIEVFVCVQVLLDVVYLYVDGFGNEQVGAGVEIF